MKPTHIFRKDDGHGHGKRIKGQLIRAASDDPRIKRRMKTLYLSTSAGSAFNTAAVIIPGETWLIQSAGPKAAVYPRQTVEQWPHDV